MKNNIILYCYLNLCISVFKMLVDYGFQYFFLNVCSFPVDGFTDCLFLSHFRGLVCSSCCKSFVQLFDSKFTRHTLDAFTRISSLSLRSLFHVFGVYTTRNYISLNIIFYCVKSKVLGYDS